MQQTEAHYLQVTVSILLALIDLPILLNVLIGLVT